MKKVLLFEVIGVESQLGCYLSDLNAILSQWSVSAKSYPVYNDKTALVNTANVDRKQLPTEKLFCLVMFSGRDENPTFTQLEQKEWLRFTETLTSDGFLRVFYLLCRSLKTINP